MVACPEDSGDLVPPEGMRIVYLSIWPTFFSFTLEVFPLPFFMEFRARWNLTTNPWILESAP